MHVALSAAILCGFHNATSFAMPVACSAAMQCWFYNAIIGYACCPFCGNSVLVPRCDVIRHDPLRGNPALVPICDFSRHACCALDAISLAMPVALPAEFLCVFVGTFFSCTASRCRAALGSQSVRPLPGPLLFGCRFVCIEPLCSSASVGISA